MTKKKEERLEVKVKTLKTIYEPVNSYSMKIDSLLEGHYKKEFRLSRTSMPTLMELKVSCEILKSYFEDLFEQAEDAGVSFLFLEASEIQTIVGISKTINLAGSATLENISLVEN